MNPFAEVVMVKDTRKVICSECRRTTYRPVSFYDGLAHEFVMRDCERCGCLTEHQTVGLHTRKGGK